MTQRVSKYNMSLDNFGVGDDPSVYPSTDAEPNISVLELTLHISHSMEYILVEFSSRKKRPLEMSDIGDCGLYCFFRINPYERRAYSAGRSVSLQKGSLSDSK